VPDLDASTEFLGLYDRTAVPSLGDTRGVTEKVKGAYFQTDFDLDVGMRVTGNFGARYAHTKQSSFGYVGTTYQLATRTYDDFLPAFNVNLFPTENFIIRGAVAQVVTRPSLGSVTPGGSVDEFNFRITRGNPYLTPYRAWNYDLSLEWYFARGAILSLALFKKDISSFPTSVSNQITYAESGLPTSILTPGRPAYVAVVGGADPDREFEERTSTDGEGASIKGIELGLNLPLSVFSESLKDFGVLGNVTYVDSSADYTFNGQDYTVSFAGVSKYSANGTVYYDNGRFSVRVSGAYRSDYNTGTSATGNFLEGFGSTFNLDASIRYKVTDNIELLIDGNNLTDEYRYRWTDEFARRNYENNHFGRIIMVGARFEL
jgi:TonB-dependent receptor